ncbi:polyprenyl synthetase family protein [Taibaiella koreensis]|uniref:polyprenyl synthetase family protein n=1 Tax=Taibaiella koreensis TaxID=1268548 RepID=UPI000E59A389|nr:polyprenyl synthetase family protein [Taibaiella koreensis]
MRSFQEISLLFEQYLKASLPFPGHQEQLYEPCRYLLEAGGKRVRPALCLMAGELFGGVNDDAYHAAMAVELFHNFTLIHDDIMDKAPLRRGKPTVHAKYGLTTGILSGDVMGIFAYHCLGMVKPEYLQKVFQVFNKTAIEVCEGQQWDMDFEAQEEVSIDEYLKMIELKTSVLLAASLQIGAIVTGAPDEDARHLYEFGKNMGIAFQLQDDYLDTFGAEEKIGKKPGGDIRANKKTFLALKTREVAEAHPVMTELMQKEEDERVDGMRRLYLDLNIDEHSRNIINQYSEYSFAHLDKINLPDDRKQPLRQLAAWLLNRQY